MLTLRVRQSAASSLALWAKPGAAAALGNPPDNAAVPAPAALALAPVNLEALGEIAQLAVGPGIVAQRRTARLDRFAKDFANSSDKAFQRRLRHLARRLARIDSRAIKRLADVDIAEARHHALIEQQELDRLLAPGERGFQVARGELRPERFGAHRGKRRPLVQRLGRDQVDEAEPAR